MIATEYELLQIRDLAANYSDRHGLRIVPMALAILLQTVPIDEYGLVHLLLLATGVYGYKLVGRYYRRRFGEVEELPVASTATQLLHAVFLALLLPCMVFDVSVQPPAFVSGILVAAWLIHARGGRAPYARNMRRSDSR